MSAKVRPVPEGYHTVTPWICSRDTARLLDFVKEAFGAEEMARVPAEDGSIGHAEFRIGDSVVMAFTLGRSGRRLRLSSACISKTAMRCIGGRWRPGPRP
jgi:uncharacterized glyoxalase superfamily protein PhnB